MKRPPAVAVAGVLFVIGGEIVLRSLHPDHVALDEVHPHPYHSPNPVGRASITVQSTTSMTSSSLFSGW